MLVLESGWSVLLVVFWRCVLGGLGLTAWVLATRQWTRPTRAEWLWLLVGGLALVLNWVSLFSAYRYSSITVATVVYQVQPFLLLLLAALFLGEPVPLRRLPWLGLALLGVVLSSGLPLPGMGSTDSGAGGDGSATLWGTALAVLAASLYALATLATQRLRRIAPAQIAMLQMGVGVLALALPAYPLQLQATLTGAAAGAVLTLGLVHTALMYTLMYAAFQRLNAQAIAGLSFIYPVVALLVDLLWFGLRPQPVQWLGMVLILAAVGAYRHSQHRAK